MKIAALAWGSLWWDPRELRIRGPWHVDGPVLPLEFSRKSGGGRLTLVIDEAHGVAVRALFAESGFDDLDAAVANLRDREGMKTAKKIGFAVKDKMPGAFPGAAAVAAWLKAAGFDAAIWTALESNFREALREEFSVAAALVYLESLTGQERADAFAYIRKAPPQVRTRLRDAFEEHFGM